MGSAFRLPADLLGNLPDPDRGPEIWVVGGALRDHLLGRPYDDLDFVVDRGAIPFARQIANSLSWDFFVLDQERGAARILPKEEDYPIRRMDFSELRGGCIEADLRKRDFTINALGASVRQLSKLIDPTGGLEDLKLKQLRTTGPDSLSDDAVRVLRAIRFAADLEFTIQPGTTAQIKKAVQRIQEISIERVRDELFRILGCKNVAAAVSLLDHFSVIEAIFPDIIQTGRSNNGGSASLSPWQIALSQLRKLAELMLVLQPRHDAEAAADATWGSVSLRLGRFRESIGELLEVNLSEGRPVRSLLYFTILGMARTDFNPGGIASGRSGLDALPVGVQKCQKLLNHADQFRLSRAEGVYIGNASAACAVLEAVQQGEGLSDVDVHRYFRSFAEAGVTAVLIYLSSAAARSAGPPDADLWEHRLKVARILWEAYFERYEDVVAPISLLDGSDLMEALGMESGPRVGELLLAIKEAQVSEGIRTREQAIEYARQLMSSKQRD
jgi:tRNA nucleotidyltransferase/poly(A) polymerase